ncbi:MAG: 50S ribosomal protein L29 [Archaeoglobales archaeon]|nr:MAG: 50S ribosomal protein L29 [Archaeoglobales archaeon]
MRMKDVRKMERDEKLKKLKELEMELLKLRTKKRSGAGLENPMAIRNIKRDIARIKLALREEGYET